MAHKPLNLGAAIMQPGRQVLPVMWWHWGRPP